MKQSLRIVEQCVEEIHPGPVRADIDAEAVGLVLERGVEAEKPLAEGPVRSQSCLSCCVHRRGLRLTDGWRRPRGSWPSTW